MNTLSHSSPHDPPLTPTVLDNLIARWQGAKQRAKEARALWQEEERQMVDAANQLGDALLPADSPIGDTFIFQATPPGAGQHHVHALLITKISSVRHLGETNFNIRWKG